MPATEPTNPLTIVRSFFEAVVGNSKMSEELEQVDFRVQFRTVDGEVLYVGVGQNGFEVHEGEEIAEDDLGALYLVEASSCFADIFRGETTIGNAIFDHKLRIPGYRNKEPLIGAFSRFVRLGIWATVPGATILRPAK